VTEFVNERVSVVIWLFVTVEYHFSSAKPFWMIECKIISPEKENKN